MNYNLNTLFFYDYTFIPMAYGLWVYYNDCYWHTIMANKISVHTENRNYVLYSLLITHNFVLKIPVFSKTKPETFLCT